MGSATKSYDSEMDDSLTLADMLQLRYKKSRVTAQTLEEAPSHGSKPSSEEPRHASSPSSSMTCSRRNPAPSPDRGLDPKEVLGFLHDAAVSVPAAIKDPARALRLSGQAYRYRHCVSLCRTSEVDEGFRPERLLGFVRGIAVSFGDGEGESGEIGRELAQLDSYRRFVSVQPRWSWSYEQDLEIENEESQGSDQEISGSSPTSEEEYGVISELEDDDISIEIQEEVFEDEMQDGRVICVTNREDFSLLDEDYDSMLSTCEAVEYCGRSSGEDNFSGENVKIKSQESEVDAYVEEDQAEADGTAFQVPLKSIGHFPNHVANDLLENIADLSRQKLIVKSEITVALDRISETTTENSRLEQEDTVAYVGQSIPVQQNNSMVVPTLCLEEILPESVSCDDILKSDVKCESCASVSAIGSDDSPKEASQGLLVEKIMLDQSVRTGVEHDNVESSTVAIPSTKNCFPSSPGLGGQLLVDPANDPEANSCNGMLSHDVSSQHCVEDNVHFSSDDNNQGGNSNNASFSNSPTETPYGIVLKREPDQYVASDSVNCNFTPSSRSNAYATRETTRTDNDDIVASIRNDNLNSSLLEASKTTTSHDRKRSNSCLDIPKHSLKSKKERSGCDSADISKWRRLYVSPLTRDESKSPSVSFGRNEESTSMNTDTSSSLPLHASKSTSDRKNGSNLSSSLPKHAARIVSRKNGSSHHPAADHFNGHRVYASASTTGRSKSPRISRKLQIPNRFRDIPKSLHMKFPWNFNLPSKQELVKKFQVFGQLDSLRTKVSTITGAAQVVFLHESDAYAAYEYVKRKSIFGHANVRFWFDEHENFRKGIRTASATKAPSVNLKSCLKIPERDKKEKLKVRFSIESS